MSSKVIVVKWLQNLHSFSSNKNNQISERNFQNLWIEGRFSRLLDSAKDTPSKTGFILEITGNLRLAIDRKQITCSLFLDSPKAFDTVNHNIQGPKLPFLGRHQPATEIFFSFAIWKKLMWSPKSVDTQRISLSFIYLQMVHPHFVINFRRIPKHALNTTSPE